MKRALAERAKQSESAVSPNCLVAPTAVQVPSSTSSGQPPRKLPRIDEAHQQQALPRVKTEPITVPTLSSSTAPPRPSPLGTPREEGARSKRQRASTPVEDENGDSAFYLKHQNRALASELKGLQYQLRLLEKERDLRRQHCYDATQALQALQSTWTQMEVALQLGMPPEKSSTLASMETFAVVTASEDVTINTAASSSEDGGGGGSIRNTGSGDNVELVGALLDSLASLGKEVATTTATNNEDSLSMDASTYSQLRDMKRTASLISQRAATLQTWIWNLLKRIHTQEGQYASIMETASLKGQVATLSGQVTELEARIAELVTTKDEAVQSDRKVRRGLYRLAAGRMKLEDVLQAVEDDDKDGTVAALIQMEVQQHQQQQVAAAAVSMTSGTIEDAEEGEIVNGAHVVTLRKQLQDLEEIASSRETQIEQLMKEREEHAKRINALSLPQSTLPAAISDEDIKRSPLYTETATRLTTAERQLAELKSRMTIILKKYATQKGDAELATKSLEEHLEKFKKRWEELTGSEANEIGDLYGDDDQDETMGDSDQPPQPALLTDSRAQAKRIVELEHKLKQALENVRQADAVRLSLTEAQRMNETLRKKIDEMKVKNAALLATRTESRQNAEAAAAASSSKEKLGSSTPVSEEGAERLLKDNRKMKKELAASRVSKKEAKAKQERAEKERDELMESNSRLLQQSTEKDDMNARSLSTILHLKSLTEQYEQEKLARDQEAKSLEQVSLAARLAENARERVAEEALKEKALLEEKVAETENECDRLKREKEVADGALSHIKAEMSCLESSVGTMKNRCEELATESTKLQEEKRKLAESLAVAQRESAEAANKLAAIRESGGVGTSGFTAEQLEKQAKVLKSRLTCPVCNVRDKQVILLRCRHMFCRNCVDENVKNRSRKCPACAYRFDTKDVSDVWL